MFKGANDALVEEIASMELFNHGQYTHAALRRKNINAEVKQITELRLSITRPIDEAKKAVMQMFGPSIEIREAAVKALDVKLTKYVADQKAATEQAREVATTTLVKAQSKELTLAEQARQRAKQQREEAVHYRKLADETEIADEAARLRERADHFDSLAAQNEARAEQREETAQSIDPEAVNIAEANLDVDGVSTKHPWKGRITDLDEVLRQIADHKIELTDKTRSKLEAVLQSEVNDLARALKKNNPYKGLHFFQDTQIASTRS